MFDQSLLGKVSQVLVLSMSKVLGLEAINARAAKSLKTACDRLFEEILASIEPCFSGQVLFYAAKLEETQPRECVLKVSDRYLSIASNEGRIVFKSPLSGV